MAFVTAVEANLNLLLGIARHVRDIGFMGLGVSAIAASPLSTVTDDHVVDTEVRAGSWIAQASAPQLQHVLWSTSRRPLPAGPLPVTETSTDDRRRG